MVKPVRRALLVSLAEAGYPDGTGFPVVQLWSADKAESSKAELTAYRGAR
jgi:hypothetical protein